MEVFEVEFKSVFERKEYSSKKVDVFFSQVRRGANFNDD